MSSLLLSKTDIGLKLFFAHNVRYCNSVTFRILVALEYLQYLDNHVPQRFDFCIERTPTDRTSQLYHHQVKIMIINEGTNNLVSGAFLKCFSIVNGRHREGHNKIKQPFADTQRKRKLQKKIRSKR